MTQHSTDHHTDTDHHGQTTGERGAISRVGVVGDSVVVGVDAGVGDLDEHLACLHEEALAIVEEEAALQATSSAAAHWRLARTVYRFMTTPAAPLPCRPRVGERE